MLRTSITTDEERIPLVSSESFNEASQAVIERGDSILVAESGKIIEIDPSKKEPRVIHTIPPPRTEIAGKEYEIDLEAVGSQKNSQGDQSVPRLRMFAGPNGSGKSTFKSVIRPEWLGIYLNADDLENEILTKGKIDLSSYKCEGASAEELQAYFQNNAWASDQLNTASFQITDGTLYVRNHEEVNSYIASTLIAFFREKLIESRTPFTFETVMSHPSKVEMLNRAQAKGFRCYLYYIATEHPDINVSRVEGRVKAGGHDVPLEKIKSRYYRSLKLVPSAIQSCDRTFIFDNSRKQDGSIDRAEQTYIAAIDRNKARLRFHSTMVPHWFQKYIETPLGISS